MLYLKKKTKRKKDLKSLEADRCGGEEHRFLEARLPEFTFRVLVARCGTWG